MYFNDKLGNEIFYLTYLMETEHYLIIPSFPEKPFTVHINVKK